MLILFYTKINKSYLIEARVFYGNNYHLKFSNKILLKILRILNLKKR